MSLLRSKKKTWTAVTLPAESFVTDEAFQFLSSIEESNDYSLVNCSDETVENGKKTMKPALKRKSNGSAEKRKEKRQKSDVKDEKNREEELEKPKSLKIMSNRPKSLVKLDDHKSPKSKLKKQKSNKVKMPEKTEVLTTCDKEKRFKTIENDTENTEETSNNPEDQSNSNDTDPSPWNAFGLTDSVIEALKSLKFTEPTPIQRECLLPAIRDKLDLLGAAETGSGKTLAFALPIIQGILDSREESSVKTSKALILTPTRELAIQIKNHIYSVVRDLKIRVSVVVGGLSVQKQERLLSQNPDIIVATPGRLWSLMQESTSDCLKNLPNIQYLVIDETDRMVEKGHFQELALILDNLAKGESVKNRQTFVFSATLAFVHPPPKRLVSKQEAKQMTPKQKIEMLVSLTRLRDARKIVDLTQSFGTAESLTETKVICDSLEDKDACLYYFLATFPGRTIVFANSIDCTRRLRNLLLRLNFTPMVLNAQMHQKQRLKNLEKFSESSAAVLLATDVAARGLDIKNIKHVIHYQVPRAAEIYVHRSGRTARANHEGISVMLVDSQDALAYRKVCQNLNRDEDLPEFPLNSKLLSFLQQRVVLATELESLQFRLAKQNARKNWFQRAAIEAELDDEEGGNMDEEEQKEADDQKRKIKSLEKQLAAMLKQPVPRENCFSTKYPTLILQSGAIEEMNKKKKTALEIVKEDSEKPVIKAHKVRAAVFKKKFKKNE